MTTALDFLSGGNDARAFDVNASGIACGNSLDGSSNRHAVIWDTDTGAVTQLVDPTGYSGIAEAIAIADDGTVVGYSGTHAIKWTDPSTAVDLGTIAQAWAIASSGNIAGNKQVGGLDHATLWHPSASDLGVLAPATTSFVRGLNASDDAVGYSGAKPVIWPAGGAATDLGDPTGDGARCEDINDAGDVVGSASDGLALLWPGGGAAVSLPALTGGSFPVAEAINATADIVGSGFDSLGNLRGVLWIDSGALGFALDQLISEDYGEALGINATRVMVGDVSFDEGAHKTAVVFTVTLPVTPPTPFLIEDSFYEELGVE